MKTRVSFFGAGAGLRRRLVNVVNTNNKKCPRTKTAVPIKRMTPKPQGKITHIVTWICTCRTIRCFCSMKESKSASSEWCKCAEVGRFIHMSTSKESSARQRANSGDWDGGSCARQRAIDSECEVMADGKTEIRPAVSMI